MDNFIKTDEGALINNDYNEYLKILAARKEAKKNKLIENRVSDLEEKVAYLEQIIKNKAT